MIQMRTLTQIDLGREMVLELGLAISWDSTIRFVSNFHDLLSKLQHSSGPICKVFGWLQTIILDALGDLRGLGLELGEMKKRKMN